MLVGGSIAERASRLVDPGEPVEVAGPRPRFVGRGGEKLDAALDRFGVTVTGATALDAGASTGGFTDCTLQRGARRVIAVDVGHGQLHPRLRRDPRVVVLERTDIRDLTPGLLVSIAGPTAVPVDVVTADLSFISLESVVPVLTGPLLRPAGTLVLLVKPQFEAGRVTAGRAALSRGKGVVRDPAIWLHTLRAVASSLVDCGAAIIGAMPSPLRGAAGNAEFLLHAIAGPTATSGPPLAPPPPGALRPDGAGADALLQGAVDEAAGRAG